MRGALLGGRYQLREPLGSGGMGTVWRARDQLRQRDVAVKMVTGFLGTDTSELARRFHREIRVASLLRHPHIVEVHDSGEADVDGHAVLYLVMAEIPGEPLNRLLAARPPSLAEVARWGGEICAALSAMHDVGIVHRDLKPANVMIGPDGHATVLDFGIARLDRDSIDLTTLTHTGHVLGTFAYMSPEQAGGGTELDARSDLYSLGCLLYATLVGRPPFSEGPWHLILRQHLDEVPPPASAGRAGLPAAWDALLADLLAKQPEDRPPSAAAVGERIAALPVPEDASAETVPAQAAVHPPTLVDPDAVTAGAVAGTPGPVPRARVLPGEEVISRALTARQLLALGALVMVLLGGLVTLILVASGRDTGQSVGASGLITAGGLVVAIGGGALYSGYWDGRERRRDERQAEASRRAAVAYRSAAAQVSDAIQGGRSLWVGYEYEDRFLWMHLHQMYFADGDLVGIAVNSGQEFRIAEFRLRATSDSDFRPPGA
ncbi:protein kinase [Streptomyces sp. NPDC059063]|uniref:serine/threonine-protein kinase n=1 Tax=unclassified Streptomyces TaxID=2593676 RepID=UPI0036CBFFF5